MDGFIFRKRIMNAPCGSFSPFSPGIAFKEVQAAHHARSKALNRAWREDDRVRH